jgi:hypothetical protein
MNHPFIPRDQLNNMLTNQIWQAMKQGPNQNPLDIAKILPLSAASQLQGQNQRNNLWVEDNWLEDDDLWV